MRTLAKLSTGLCLFGLIEMANAATIYVPDYGSTGPQTFSYIFAGDFSDNVTIGVSDAGDDVESSFLTSSTYSFSLDTDGLSVQDTSNYFNTLGEAGTDGELYTFAYSASAGDVLTFDWEFSTDDYHPYHDFAFVDIAGEHYEVIAEIAAVPVPAAVWLFGSGLLGLLGLRKKSQIVVQRA